MCPINHSEKKNVVIEWGWSAWHKGVGVIESRIPQLYSIRIKILGKYYFNYHLTKYIKLSLNFR